MASVPGVGPGAGTAAVLGAKVVHATAGGIGEAFRAVGKGVAIVAGLITGALMMGFRLALDVEDPLHASPQQTV